MNPYGANPYGGQYGAPPGQYGAPPGQYGAPPGQYGAPPPGQYGAPYGAPPGQYGAPPPGQYGAPYGAPPGQYGAPYGAPPPGQYPGQYGAPPPGQYPPPDPYGGQHGAPPPGQYPGQYGAPPTGVPYGSPVVTHGVAPVVTPGVAPSPFAAPTHQTQVAVGSPVTQTVTTISYSTAVPSWSYWGLTPEAQGYPASHDPNADAERLKYAFRGLGTDEKAVIAVIGNRSKEQLYAVSQCYFQRYHKTLEHSIKSETSGNFCKLLCGLLTNRVNLKRQLLRNATRGAGTAERYLIDVLVPASNAEILELHKVDPKAIDMVLSDVTFGNFAKVIRNLVRGTREESPMVDEQAASREADALYKAGEKRLGTDDSVFIDIISTRSPQFLQRVSQLYAQRHKGRSLETAIKKETSGHYKSVLVALTKLRYEFYADRLYKAMHGLGTDDVALVYLFSLLTKQELKTIAGIFQRKRGKSLESYIKGDTSGHYEKLLRELLH